MLKIIHAADIHLGSKIDVNLSKEKSEQRRLEVCETFMRMVDFAQSEGVKIIMLSGDVFDSDRPNKRDKTYFYEIINKHPNIDFLYLRGNHDRNEHNLEVKLENLKTFDADWVYYSYDNVVIAGVELNELNGQMICSNLNLPKNTLNIVMLHGILSPSKVKDGINLKNLQNKNIDYLALGHIHESSFGKIDDRGSYAYSGCLEGRGYDETGEKGFILLNVGDKIESKFINFAKRKISKVEVDITNLQNSYEVFLKVKEVAGKDYDNLLRVILTGEISFDNEHLKMEVENLLSSTFYAVSVKDKTIRKLNLDDYISDNSLKGEFVRSVFNDNLLTTEEKNKIVTIGLKALMGESLND